MPGLQNDDAPVASVRIEVTGRDPESAVRDLTAVGAGRQWTSRRTGADYSYRYTAIGDGEVTIRRSRVQGFVRGVVDPGDDYVVQWVTAGSVVVDLDGERVESRRDVPTLYPTEQPFVVIGSDSDQRLVHLSRAMVHDVAVDHYDVGESPLRFDHHRAPDASALGRWGDALVSLSRALRDGVESRAWGDAKRAAAEAFLGLYPPRSEALPAELSLPRNARLRAMVEHVHAHVREPVTVGDLATVGELSVRSVQESFARVLGVSPLTYLREVRLERVRDDLLQQDPQSVTVGDVARRWGFAHLGRFSAAYYERFGEYPKQTLRR
ncbi:MULTISPECIES: AraC family transcriptional regulator [unclassified Curtobacterium]|uniref:AraC family transcriptional regulator n=1 Tax=unclassified Curtobacterium TaxID=257496 RepID=UPI00226B021E|nr:MULTISPECIES: helix-turn-helix transcriptional regulator [unclassified Curtobacterium]